MESIVEIKKRLHVLEDQSRTVAWDYLRKVYETDPVRADVAALFLYQLFMNLDELEGPRPWCEPEREDEYDEYYDYAQRILRFFCTVYADSVQFQWVLCYFLMCYPTYHWLDGTFYLSDAHAQKLRNELIQRFLSKHPDSMMFRYIESIQRGTVRKDKLLKTILPEDLEKLRAEIREWNLQDNYADQELMDWFFKDFL